jgi:hypothetical protein
MGEIININKNYKLEIDEMNKTLFRKIIRVKRDTKEEYEAWEIIGYYNSLEIIFKKLLDLFIKEKLSKKKINEISDTLEAIIQANQDIKILIKEYEVKCGNSHIPNEETRKVINEWKTKKTF